MKKIFKKAIGIMLATIMTMSVMSIGAFAATDEIPEGLPEGAYKVYDGIYAVDNYNTPALLNTLEDVYVAVPSYGIIAQPNALSNIIVENGHKWLCITSSEYIRINFVYGNTSIFGASLYDWPRIGSAATTTYFIETDYYGFQTGVPYKMQLTSTNDFSYSSVKICIKSSSYQSAW